jgi:hypothetical protein
MRRFIRENSLAVVSFGLFLVVFVGGQSVAGHRTYNEDQRTHGGTEISYADYLTTAHFGEATFENWESEFLQMGAYILFTVFLRQRGSAESKGLEGEEPVDEPPEGHRDDPGAPGPVQRGGIALAVYKHSLSLAFLALFVVTWGLHALTGARELSNEQIEHGGHAVSVMEFIGRSQFWFESMQNWQSEFLAVGLIVVLSVYLREQGSPESKPVHAPHSETGA